MISYIQYYLSKYFCICNAYMYNSFMSIYIYIHTCITIYIYTYVNLIFSCGYIHMMYYISWRRSMMPGLIVMTAELEAAGKSLFVNEVPEMCGGSGGVKVTGGGAVSKCGTWWCIWPQGDGRFLGDFRRRSGMIKSRNQLMMWDHHVMAWWHVPSCTTCPM